MNFDPPQKMIIPQYTNVPCFVYVVNIPYLLYMKVQVKGRRAFLQLAVKKERRIRETNHRSLETPVRTLRFV